MTEDVKLDGRDYTAIKGVTTDPMDIIVPTTVAVTVLKTLPVTDKTGIVRTDVTRDMSIVNVTKSVQLDILDQIAADVVADTA